MAGFNTAISGISAATKSLDVTGNNIANASTVGFKSSRTEFADIYATAAIGSGSSNTAGSGVLVSDIAQNFSGGNVEFTTNNLDLSIDGSGFFQLDDGRGSVTYTRNGAFELDKDGFIISKSGENLQGYGVDENGNRLPIGDLQVDEKESPPKATEVMGLSFNINEALDAEALITPYSREEAGSVTFSTTVGTFDSLGNEHTIRYDMVEQQAKKEIHTFDQGASGVYAGGAFSISGIDVDTSDVVQFPVGTPTSEPRSMGPTALADLQLADPRIFDVVFTAGTAVGEQATVQVIFESAARESGELVVGDDVSLDGANLLSNPQVTTIASNEVHTFDIPAGEGDGSPNELGAYETPQQFTIAGIQFNFNASTTSPITREQVAAEIISKETQIRDANPNIESIAFNATTNQLGFTFKADSGNVSNTSLNIQQTDGNFFGGTAAVPGTDEVQTLTNTTFVTGETIIVGGGATVTIPTPAGANGDAAHQTAIGALIDAAVAALPNVATSVTTGASTVITFNTGTDEAPLTLAGTGLAGLSIAETTAGAVIPAVEQFGVVISTDVLEGDDSFEGVYRMYAYLNPLGQRPEALDIGMASVPGSGLSQTEIGPVIIKFNPTNGILSSVNGEAVPTGVGAQVPKLTIKNADPADASTEITLDLSGTTQFANEQIVKAQSQDGYTKGDLTGVAFTANGEMIDL